MHSSITAQGVLTAARNVQTSLLSCRSLVSQSTTSESNKEAILEYRTQQNVHENMDENVHENVHESVHENVHKNVRERVLMAEITGRALGLLHYVENNIEALLVAEDPEGLQKVKERILLTSATQDPISDRSNSVGSCKGKSENENDNDNSPTATGNSDFFS